MPAFQVGFYHGLLPQQTYQQTSLQSPGSKSHSKILQLLQLVLFVNMQTVSFRFLKLALYSLLFKWFPLHVALGSIGTLFSKTTPTHKSTIPPELSSFIQSITIFIFWYLCNLVGFICTMLTTCAFLWLKEALVCPLLKKPGLDIIFKNFRPVSNLAFLSKLTEKAVFHQIHEHMVDTNLYPNAQSAYRVHHSTETALLKVKNDILLNMNKQHVTLLVLLDLSAAFDTVEHNILLPPSPSVLSASCPIGSDRIYQGAVKGY